MLIPNATIKPLHDEVIRGWQEIAVETGRLKLVDRAVVTAKLQKRAENLAIYEALVESPGGLVVDATAVASVMKNLNPIGKIMAGVGLVSGVLGFFGLWSFDTVRSLFTSSGETLSAGADQLGAVLKLGATFLTGGVLVVLVRGVTAIAREMSEAIARFNAQEHPSATLLARVGPAKLKLFGALGKRVPDVPLSVGPIVMLGIVAMAAGVIFFLLLGLGSTAQ